MRYQNSSSHPRLCSLLATLALPIAAVAQPVITHIGSGGFIAPTAISADNSVLCSSVLSPVATGFRWTSKTGMQWLASGGGIDSVATSISADGSTIVGERIDSTKAPPARLTASRWIGSDPEGTLLPILDTYTDSNAVDVSADGSIIVGTMIAYGEIRSVAVRWVNGVAESLGTLSGFSTANAAAVTDDGSVVVGYSGPSLFRWTFAQGMTAIERPDDLAFSIIASINADASTIVGNVRFIENNQYVPFIWTEGGGVHTPLPQSDTHFFVHDASADASHIVGSINALDSSVHRAAMWTQSRGVVDLNTYLPTLGLDLTGWELNLVTVMSADATVIAGRGVYNGDHAAFLITGLPGACRADFNADSAVNSQDFFDFLAAFFKNDPHADFNADKAVNSQDFFDFLAAFFAGC